MARRVTPPFRADHVGSLLRPAGLLAARDDFAAGKIDAAQLATVEDFAVRDAVRLQEEVGLQSATDGEFRREQWHADVLYAIPAIGRGALGAPLPVYRRDGQITWTPTATEVTDRVHLETPIFGDHFGFLARTVTTATPKITVPSPSMAHFRVDLSKSPYADTAQYRADIAAVYAAEVAGLYALGCRYLQFDDTIFAFLNDPAWRANASASGIDPDRQHEINVDVINVAGLSLEYDDERSGAFEPLRFVPDDQIVVLGLMTTKTPELESRDTLKRRIDEAAKYVDLDRLCISGQCGFASTVEGNALTIDEERAKLELLVETAREVWG